MNKLLYWKPAPPLFGFVTEAPNLDNDLLGFLADHIDEYPETKLIIIDTLQKIRGLPLRGETPYQQDYREMGAFKQFMDKHRVSVFFVHHNRKMVDKEDPFNMISGTTGIMGAADTVFVITKESRNAETATLHITGRDIEQSDTIIRFNKVTCRWEVVGDANELAKQKAVEEYHNSPIVTTIKALLAEASERRWDGTAKKILEAGERFTGRPIAPTTQKLSGELKRLGKLLCEYDSISHTTTSNGNAGLVHHFAMRIEFAKADAWNPVEPRTIIRSIFGVPNVPEADWKLDYEGVEF